MLLGVPREIKNHEYRVGMTPASVRELTGRGHAVLVEKGAGRGIGLTDSMYVRAGADIVNTPEEIFARAEMIVKVKEPQPDECRQLRQGQILFTYLHLAAGSAADAAPRRIGLHRHRLRDGFRHEWRSAAPCADERGRRTHVHPGRPVIASRRPSMARVFSWAVFRAWRPGRWSSSVVAWWAPMRRAWR